jgi:hypothetical protein
VPNWTRDDDDDYENQSPYGGGSTPIPCEGCGHTGSHAPGCFGAYRPTEEEFAYLWSFDPPPVTLEGMRVLLEHRRTGRKVVPPNRDWRFA